MLNIEKTPKEITMVRQTIPFIVSSSLFQSQSFNAITQSFKYVFDIKTLRDDGTYKTFASVAIPPRPDNLVGFFDPSKIILSALKFDNKTQLVNKASEMPLSIIQFRVFCTERYIDTNGDYVSGDSIQLGYYYAIDAGTNEGLEPYIIDLSGDTKLPLHHHTLLQDQLELKPNEPLTLSFLTQPALGANILDFIHGDYGSFDNGQSTNYAGIEGSNKVILSKTFQSLSGAALQCRILPNGFISSETSGNLIKFKNLNLEDNKTYRFNIWVKTNTLFAVFPTPDAIFELDVQGTGIASIVSQTSESILNARLGYTEIQIIFETNNLVDNSEEIFINVLSPFTNDLIRINDFLFGFDSAQLVELTQKNNDIEDAVIVVDEGLPTEVRHTLPTSYLADIIDFDTLSKGRFDCPVGANLKYDPLNDIQDGDTGLFLNTVGNIGKYFQLELTSETNPNVPAAKSEKIYQRPSCSRYNKVRLKWLNVLGGWDYYTFDMVSIAQKVVQRDNYKIAYGNITKTNGDFNYEENITDRGYKTLNILEDDYIIINTDWIRNETNKFLKDIITSKEVYILNPEPYFDVPTTEEYQLEYPVLVENADFEYSNNSSGTKLTNTTLRIRVATQFNSATQNG
jgi:hypothetical protein